MAAFRNAGYPLLEAPVSSCKDPVFCSMPGKLPNYHFSLQKNREISGTEACISRFRDRMSSKKKKARGPSVAHSLALSLVEMLRSDYRDV